MTIDEIKNTCNTGGKNPLLICKYCMDVGITMTNVAEISKKNRVKREEVAFTCESFIKRTQKDSQINLLDT